MTSFLLHFQRNKCHILYSTENGFNSAQSTMYILILFMIIYLFSFVSRKTMLDTISSVSFLVADILLMWFRVFLGLIEALFLKFQPSKEKSVAGEIVLVIKKKLKFV